LISLRYWLILYAPRSSRCRFPRDVFPQKDLGLVLRDALAPFLDDLKIGDVRLRQIEDA